MSHKTNAELGKALADLANQTGEQFAEVTLNVADLATKLAALEPVSSTIRTLEAYVHEGAEQVHTLNLAISRLEHGTNSNTSKHPSMDTSDSSGDGVLGAMPCSFNTTRPPSGEDHFYPRPKLDFPMYDGKDDPLPWLNRCDTFRGQQRRMTSEFGMLLST